MQRKLTTRHIILITKDFRHELAMKLPNVHTDQCKDCFHTHHFAYIKCCSSMLFVCITTTTATNLKRKCRFCDAINMQIASHTEQKLRDAQSTAEEGFLPHTYMQAREDICMRVYSKACCVCKVFCNLFN